MLLALQPGDLQLQLLDQQVLGRPQLLDSRPRCPLREDHRVGAGQIRGQIKRCLHPPILP